jgi:hypothetical protein
MEKNMGKLSDAFPYLAVAALAATGVGLAGAGAAAGAGAGTAAAAGAGALGTQTGLALGSALGSSAALGTGAALAPEAAFLASMGASSPAVAPLAAAEVGASQLALAPNTGHFMGTQYGTTPQWAQLGQAGGVEGMAGVSRYGSPLSTGTQGSIAPSHIPQLDTAYAPVDAMTMKTKPHFMGDPTIKDAVAKAGDYPFGGRAMESATPQWMDMSSNISPVVEEGTKTLMEKLNIDKGTAFQIASQFYAGSMEAPPNFQGQPVAPTGRQRTYSPSTMAQIMDRTRSNTNRQIRRSTV